MRTPLGALFSVSGICLGCANQAPTDGDLSSRVALALAAGAVTEALIDSLDIVAAVAWHGTNRARMLAVTESSSVSRVAGACLHNP